MSRDEIKKNKKISIKRVRTELDIQIELNKILMIEIEKKTNFKIIKSKTNNN